MYPYFKVWGWCIELFQLKPVVEKIARTYVSYSWFQPNYHPPQLVVAHDDDFVDGDGDSGGVVGSLFQHIPKGAKRATGNEIVDDGALGALDGVNLLDWIALNVDLEASKIVTKICDDVVD